MSSNKLKLTTNLRGHVINSNVDKNLSFTGEKNDTSIVKKQNIIVSNGLAMLCTSLLIPEIF